MGLTMTIRHLSPIAKPEAALSDITNEAAASSEVRWALVRRALQRIAANHELTPSGHRKKLTRHEAINVAREACHALGWDYGNYGRAANATAASGMNGTNKHPQHRRLTLPGVTKSA